VTTAKRHVLLVDDEELFLCSLEDGLSRLLPETHIHRAPNGQAALDILRAFPIDVVVTDIKMPKLDGSQLLAAMHLRHRQVPAIVMTAFGTPEIEARALGAGALHYIDKPVDLHLLAGRINALLADVAHGKLRGVSLPSLLQLLGMERKTGLVRVFSNTATVRLYFQDGLLVDADDGYARGLEVALRSCALERVELEFTSIDGPVGRTIDLPLNEILFEAARLRDESRQAAVNNEFDLDRLDDFERQAPTAASETQLVAATVQHQLDVAMKMDGAQGIALVDHERGLVLGMSGGLAGFDRQVAITGIAQTVQAELRTIASLGVDDQLEDILITLRRQYHIIRALRDQPHVCLYLVVDRQQANLGMTRRLMARIEQALVPHS
jgi:CheY-like chemotaxis protein